MASILIVDDDAHVRAFLSELLSGQGHRTATAVNGREALRILEEQGPFDVVVTDYHMPVLDGMELVKALAERRSGGPIPAVMVSGDPYALAIREVFTALPKPVDREELLTAVDAAVLYRSCAAWTRNLN